MSRMKLYVDGLASRAGHTSLLRQYQLETIDEYLIIKKPVE